MILPKKTHYPLVLSLLTLLLIGALFLFINTLGHLISTKRFVIRRESSPVLSISKIKPWMTFGYINRNLMLPDTLLRKALAITDPRYPSITIESVAKSKTLTSLLLISYIESAITTYRADAEDVTP